MVHEWYTGLLMGEPLYVWYSEASVPNVTAVSDWLDVVGLLYMLHKGYCDEWYTNGTLVFDG